MLGNRKKLNVYYNKSATTEITLVTDHLLQQLVEISKEMELTSEKSKDAEPKYDHLAGGIYWTDEYPASRRYNITIFQSLRTVLRYRTTLILNIPEETDLAIYWTEALKLFPSWVGFIPERQTPNEELHRFYLAESKRCDAIMEQNFGQ